MQSALGVGGRLGDLNPFRNGTSQTKITFFADSGFAAVVVFRSRCFTRSFSPVARSLRRHGHLRSLRRSGHRNASACAVTDAQFMLEMRRHHARLRSASLLGYGNVESGLSG